jgi:6-phosphogluconolactonase
MAARDDGERTYDVVVGGYGDGRDGPPLRRLRLVEERDGAHWEVLGAVAGPAHPSFGLRDPHRPVLYVVSEQAEGCVVPVFLDDPDLPLRVGQGQPSGGASPCHLAWVGGGRAVAVANYTGGTVGLLPVAADGSLEAPVAIADHGDLELGPRSDRQEAPHPHHVLAVGGDGLLVLDLGADAVVGYRLGSDGSLRRVAVSRLTPGSGPRHAVLSRDGTRLWLINELASTITVARLDPASLRVEPGPTVSILPPGHSGDGTAAEVALDPDEAVLYASHRGHDSIVRFRLGGGGALEDPRWTPSGGRTPRHFSLTPDGRWLLAANQDSGGVAAFRRQADGALTAGPTVAAGRPTYVEAW